MRTQLVESWVVYESQIKGRPEVTRSVCGGAEWAALDAGRPGAYTLVRAGLTNEGEAERLARGTSGDTPPRAVKARASAGPATPAPQPFGAAADPAPARHKSGQFAPFRTA